jgi:hypothetical protein
MIMQIKDQRKKTCKKCKGMGHFQIYEAPCIKRKYCDCETGKKRKKFIEEQTKTKDVEPIWELFSL